MNHSPNSHTSNADSSGSNSPFGLLFSSSIGKKLIMAITGLLLLGFVVSHLLGNLQIFLGQDAFNAYAKFLKSIPEVLWPARIALLGFLVLHLAMAFQLRSTNKAARPVGYRHRSTIQATAASLYMVESGMVIFIFILIHLLQFTFIAFEPDLAHLVDPLGRHDVYSMVVHSFRNPYYAWSYVVAMLALGFHLSHGISSAIHTLGFTHGYLTPRLRAGGRALAYALALGYISIPVSVQLGLLRLPKGVSL